MCLPSDPAILLCFVNTRLRDRYASLDALCEDLDIERAAIEQPLQRLGYCNDARLNRFV